MQKLKIHLARVKGQYCWRTMRRIKPDLSEFSLGLRLSQVKLYPLSCGPDGLCDLIWTWVPSVYLHVFLKHSHFLFEDLDLHLTRESGTRKWLPWLKFRLWLEFKQWSIESWYVRSVIVQHVFLGWRCCTDIIKVVITFTIMVVARRACHFLSLVHQLLKTRDYDNHRARPQTPSLPSKLTLIHKKRKPYFEHRVYVFYKVYTLWEQSIIYLFVRLLTYLLILLLMYDLFIICIPCRTVKAATH